MFEFYKNKILLLNENLQLADKLFFKTGLLDQNDKELILSITNGDQTTKLICELYHLTKLNPFLSKNIKKTLKLFHWQLKNYNKNVLPIKDFDIYNGCKYLYEILTKRYEILENLKKLPSIAIRNLKQDIRKERDYNDFYGYSQYLDYFIDNLSYLSNREPELRKKIEQKLYKSNSTLKDWLDFMDEKENLLGGENFTKEQILNLINTDYNLKVIYDKTPIMVVEVSDADAMKKLGCNSLWCFTYGENNYSNFSMYSTNDIVYAIIDFRFQPDSPNFMYVLIAPINTESENENGPLFNMMNEPQINCKMILSKLVGKNNLKMFNFDYNSLNEVVTDRNILFDKSNIPKKDVQDPALLTFDEYYKMINYSNKYHDSHAYNHSLEDNPDGLTKITTNDKLIKNFTIGKLRFQMYEDLEKLVYGYHDTDDVYHIYTDEEVKEKGYRLYSNSLKIKHIDENIVVGTAQDEWGCVLIQVLKEYRSLGLGELLVKTYRTKFPNKESGGFTNGGYQQFKKYYVSLVKKYLANGIYSEMIRKNEISKEKVKNILNSIKGMPVFKKPTNPLANNYGGQGKYIILLTNASIVIFDIALFDIFKNNENVPERFINKLIKAFIYVNQYDSNKDYVNLYSLYTSDPIYCKEAFDIMLSLNKDGISDKFIDSNNDLSAQKNLIENIFKKYNIRQETDYNGTINVITIKQPVGYISQLNNFSKQWFKKNDPYQEFENFLLEHCTKLCD